MIDLHTHTTASDGRCAPDELVARARSAGITVLAVTDHDTVAGCEAAGAACERAGIVFVAGIEITHIDRAVPEWSSCRSALRGQSAHGLRWSL